MFAVSVVPVKCTASVLRKVTLRFPDQNDFELDANLLLDTLHSDSPALPKADNDRLFYTVLEDYIDIPNKRDRMKKMKADPHYNALQVKYAYAVTCHKAQGGQWQNVFLDQGYMTDEYLTPDYFVGCIRRLLVRRRRCIW